jgi:hypothetical protein
LTDDEIREALLEGSPAGSCPHEDRLWDLARGTLDPEAAAKILDHTLDCPDCSLAMRVAHETFAVSGLLTESPRAAVARPSLWNRFSAGLLQPAPALAYLILLILSFPIYRLLAPSAPEPAGEGPSSSAPAITGKPGATAGDGASTVGTGARANSHEGGVIPELRSLRVLRLTGDLSLRGEGGTPQPVRIELGEGEALVLKLFPDPESLPKDPASTLVVRVLDGGTVVASTMHKVNDLEGDQSLSLLLERAVLQPGKPYVVELCKALPEAGSTAATAGRGPVISQGPPILRQTFIWARN